MLYYLYEGLIVAAGLFAIWTIVATTANGWTRMLEVSGLQAPAAPPIVAVPQRHPARQRIHTDSRRLRATMPWAA